MRLLLIRHGETADNVAQTIGSRPPGPPLSPVGVDQARTLAGRLAGEPIAAVHSSRALRAAETAAVAAAALGVPHHELHGLLEIDAGDLEGLSYADALPGYMGTMQKWWTDRDARIPGGESGSEFVARYDAAVASVVSTTDPASTAVIVSHEAAICVWAANTADNLDAEFSRTHGLRNTGVVALEGSPDRGWVAVSWDDDLLSR